MRYGCSKYRLEWKRSNNSRKTTYQTDTHSVLLYKWDSVYVFQRWFLLWLCNLCSGTLPPSRRGDRWDGKDPMNSRCASGGSWPSSPSGPSRPWWCDPDLLPVGILIPELVGPPPVYRIRGPSGPFVYLNPANPSAAAEFPDGRSELE